MSKESAPVLLLVSDAGDLSGWAEAFAAAGPPLALSGCAGLEEGLRLLASGNFEALVVDAGTAELAPASLSLRLPSSHKNLPLFYLLPAGAGTPDVSPNQATTFLARDPGQAYLSWLPRLVHQAVARRRAELAQNRSQQHFQTLLDNTPDSIVTLSPTGHIQAVNQAFSQATGRQAAACLGQPFADLLAEGDIDLACGVFDLVRKGGARQQCQLHLNSLDGQTLLGAFTIFPVYEGQTLSAVMLTAQEIKPERRSEEMEAGERDQLAFLINAVPATISWVRADLTYRAVNRQLAALYHVTPESFAGKPLGFMAEAASAEAYRRFAQAVFASPEAELADEFPVTVNREKRHFLFVGHRQRHGQEAIIIGLDITERKRTEEAQQRQLKELTLLHAVAMVSAQATSEDELIVQVTGLIGNTFYPENFGVLLLDKEAGILEAHASYHMNKPAQFTTVPLDRGISGLVARTGEPVTLSDVTTSSHYLQASADTRSEVCVPLKTGNRVIGVINAESTDLNAFTDADMRLLDTVASQLAPAILRLRAEAEERYRARQLATISEVGRRISSILDEEQLLPEVVRAIAEQMNFYNAAIAFIEDDCLVFRTGHGGYSDGAGFQEDSNRLNLGVSVAGRAAATGKPVLAGDVSTVPDYVHYHRLPRLRAELAVPLRQQERVIGVLAISSARVNGISAADAELLMILADQVSIAIQNARLYKESQRQTQELSGLYATALATSAVLDRQQLLDRLYKQVQSLLAPDVVLVVVYHQETGELEVVMSMEEGQAVAGWQGWRLPLEEGGLTGWVLRQQQTLHLHDLSQEALPASPRHGERPARSWLGVPLIARERLVGAFSVQSFRANAFSPADRRFLESVASQVAVALENARLFEEVGRRAQELETLTQLSTVLRSARTVQEVLPFVLEQAVVIVGGKESNIFLLDPESQALVLRGHYPERAPAARQDQAAQGERPPVAPHGLYLASQAGVTLEMATQAAMSGQDEPLSSSIALPLRAEEQVVGVMHVGLGDERTFRQDEVHLLKAIAEMAGSALYRAMVLDTLEQRVKARTQQLARANERLQELDRLKSKFVADVSHELRTPVANLNLYLDLLQRGKPEKQAKYLAILKQEVNRLTRIIDPILNLSQLEVPAEGELTLVPVDVNRLAQQVVEANYPRVDAGNVALVFKPQTNLPPVLGSPHKLAQVLTNLVNNALNYTGEGEVCVRTWLEEEGKDVCLAVIDTGVGIAPEDSPHLFERFYRGKPASQMNVPGAGLGLAIVREIVEAHGGRVTVESEHGRGSTFTVRLPAYISPH